MQEIIYLFDPLCGWCYGASAALDKLAADPNTHIRLQPTGLFAGTGRVIDAEFAVYAWDNDQRIAAMTGLVFSQTYREQILNAHGLAFDSLPMLHALTAVSQIVPEREIQVLKAFQTARYIDGKNTADVQIITEILNGLGLQKAAEIMTTADIATSTQTRIQAGQALAQQYGLRGVPNILLKQADGTWQVGDNRALFN